MLRSTHPVGFLDVQRVPYEVVTGRARSGLCELAGDGGRLVFCREAAASRSPEWYRLDELLLPARVVPAGDMAVALRAVDGSWEPAEPVLDGGGRPAAFVFRTADGGVALPLDPDDVILGLLSEAYAVGGRAGARRLAARVYYGLRPVLPRRLQIALRRGFSRVQARSTFPAWPLETALHDLADRVLRLAAEAAGGSLPAVSSWPWGKRWTLVLTHDVERADGYEHRHLLREIEEELGLRSSWNFVPERDYAVDDEAVAALVEAGFEVGLHGLRHDGRDLDAAVLEQRLPAMRAHAERWGAVGFRSPATHRSWELMPRLGFEYDSSFPDTDPYEPQAGGCCSLLPFFIGDLVELPLTLPQDHTLFAILRRTDASIWHAKTDAIRARGGMALLNTHPDYMLDDGSLSLYRSYLAGYRDDPDVWHALPREAADWWRRRRDSALVPGPGGGWRIEGPAAEDGSVVAVGFA